MNAQARHEGPLTGAVLEGAYQIGRLIGEGGMGAVYEAVQLRLNKRVAVKLMARALSANTEALARFRREAEIASRLGHPHLVNVIDFGTAETGEPYLVMEYLDGEDLDHRLRRARRLPLETVVHICKQVASALGAAHDQGIVHRDLKPANLFLQDVPGEPDYVKVLDFGISKIKAARTKLTRASAVMGTPNYMSPEQATGMVDEIDHRADQWALACIVWEMLSGRTPFVADEASAVLYQVINLDPPPLSKRAPHLPPGMEPVLRRALSKKMEDRWPSIREFVGALQAAALVPAIGATPLATSPSQSMAEQIPISQAVTTFSQNAGELLKGAPARSFKPLHVVLAAVGIAVAMGAILLLRSGGAGPKPVTSQRPMAASAPAMGTSPVPAPAAPPPTPAPAPVAVPSPPVPVAAPAIPVAGKKRPSSAKSERPNPTEAAAKESAPWVDPFAEGKNGSHAPGAKKSRPDPASEIDRGPPPPAQEDTSPSTRPKEKRILFKDL
jgi:eukaryotic-like serine/threonine-protein kinase